METVATDATAKAQAFAHRLVEFADFEACVKFFDEREIDFDRPNDMGWSVLMSVCACGSSLDRLTSCLKLRLKAVAIVLCAIAGRDDLVGFVVDRTNAVDCATNSNRTTVLHLTAMSKNSWGQPALHLAVLSENPNAVESLLTNAPDLDITLRNEAGNTALDLSKRISGVASAQMEDLLNVKWAQYEREAAQLSSKVEQELMYLAVKEAEDAAGRNQAIKMKTGKKKNKKYRQKAKIPDNTLVKEAEATSVEQDEVEAILEETNIDTSSELIAKVELEQSARGLVQELDNDKDNWQSVLPNKSRKFKTQLVFSVSANCFASGRKETAKDSTKARRGVSKNQHKGCTKKKTANKNSNRNPPQSAHETSAKVPKQISPSSTTPKAPWASQTITSSANPPSPRSQVTSEEDEDQTVSSDNSYERLNRSFQRTFPVAAELEIDVEKFLIASSVSDRELEPNASLSISQVEALQEAHWQAYHYLNEKKVRLR
ncbi:unnamed protein product [Phytophthora lilii]|uniref:Unnamed protein product n=1 Tax=Phytophthora lilii TaxID=2077276 RepID=A0A9W6WRS3_9STRA|nr:unnamed protein product [Phytophthora lilii]